ncbi:MAG: hypothetical protein H6502_02235 [Candidatus Woesearchaeota archaeon]|nr:MAG: hypothetical protein H6502_02235 [Candidatus Woesearchaeota archaeon]
MGFIALMIFGWLLFPMLIVLGVTYAKKRKLYHLLYILSVFAYVIFVTYCIETFELRKGGIMSLLIFSAALMIGVGLYYAKNKK